jgi:hypothetical protein
MHPPGAGSASALTSDMGGEIVPKKIHRRSDADPKEGGRKYGKVSFAEPMNRSTPSTALAISKPRGRMSTSRRTRASTPRGSADYQDPHSADSGGKGVKLPDPDEFVELMRRLRKKKR